MIEYIILSILFFFFGFASGYLLVERTKKKPTLNEFQLRKIRLLLQDKYLKTDYKMKKIISIIQP